MPVFHSKAEKAAHREISLRPTHQVHSLPFQTQQHTHRAVWEKKKEKKRKEQAKIRNTQEEKQLWQLHHYAHRSWPWALVRLGARVAVGVTHTRPDWARPRASGSDSAWSATGPTGVGRGSKQSRPTSTCFVRAAKYKLLSGWTLCVTPTRSYRWEFSSIPAPNDCF